jgi:hypothetical protein
MRSEKPDDLLYLPTHAYNLGGRETGTTAKT